MPGPPKGTGGRPKKFDDEKFRQLKEFMRLKPTLQDTAAFFDVGTRTVEDEIKDRTGLTFREFRDQNMVHTRMMLVRTALNKAKSGDNTMLIFSLKNLCNWRDKIEQSETESFDDIEFVDEDDQ